MVDPQRLCLECAGMYWEGGVVGREIIPRFFYIDEFEGPMPITELPIYPLAFHPSTSELEQRLISRGKKFEAHRVYQYSAYDGIGFDTWTGEYEIHVNSRVIIDTAAFYQLHTGIRSMWPDSQYKCDSKSTQLRVRKHERGSLCEELLHLCVPTFRAYSVNDKEWVYILVDDVKDIQWDDQAFQNLALPQEDKDMILAFANSQIRHGEGIKNVIQGKGNGVIVLCGTPVARKTRTAEAIAEKIHAPPYTLSARDVGLLIRVKADAMIAEGD